VNSLERFEKFKEALLRTDEVMPGLLGMVQDAAALEKQGIGGRLFELPDDPGELDEALLDIAAFCFWLRSDEAPVPDVEKLASETPQIIETIAQEAGIA
jgi:hypothetical protein